MHTVLFLDNRRRACGHLRVETKGLIRQKGNMRVSCHRMCLKSSVRGYTQNLLIRECEYIPVRATAGGEAELRKINRVLPTRGVNLCPDLLREIHMPVVPPFPFLSRVG